MAQKKEEMLKQQKNNQLTIGTRICVYEAVLNKYGKNDKKVRVTVTGFPEPDYIDVCDSEDNYYRISKNDVLEVDMFNVGANPFAKKPWMNKIDRMNLDLYSIMNRCGFSMPRNSVALEHDCDIIKGVPVPELNWNPFVEINGVKKFYQRDFCWTLQNKRDFIESIYNNGNCGLVILRERDYKWVEKMVAAGENVAFFDVVDGKQRLSTLIDFLTDKFTDNYGNYYSDFSEAAQIEFRQSKILSLCVLSPSATDEDVIDAFLGVNYAGVPMSEEHIDYVKKLKNEMN